MSPGRRPQRRVAERSQVGASRAATAASSAPSRRTSTAESPFEFVLDEEIKKLRLDRPNKKRTSFHQFLPNADFQQMLSGTSVGGTTTSRQRVG